MKSRNPAHVAGVGRSRTLPEGPADAGAVTVITVGYNSAGVIAPCVKSVIAAGALALVVDNASADDTADQARAAGANVLMAGANLGFGRACNLGARAALSPWLLFLNPDAVLDPGALPALLHAAAANPSVGLVAPTIIEPDGRVMGARRGILGPWRSGACLLVRRETFLALGGFDENIFLFYEDDDLCRRMVDAGLAIVDAPDAIVRHIRGASGSGAGGAVNRARWHQAWSRHYVLRKYAKPWRGPLAGWLARFALKYLLASIAFNPARRARYAGSFLGAWAFARGKVAFDAALAAGL